MNIVNKKILITGACGFIGSHLAEKLLSMGCRVRAMVLYNSANSWGWLDYCPEHLRENLEVVLGDIRDAGCVSRIMKDCDVVFHLAALIAIPYSYESPESYVETNVRGTLNLLEAARMHGVDRFVQTSTSEVYGTAQFVPIKETHPLCAQSPYAASKIAGDQLSLSYHLSFGLPVAVVRPFNTYGPRQSARAVIPTVITQFNDALAKNEKPHLKLGATHPTRDFSFVSDTVDGFIKACESNAAIGEVVNLGSSFEVSIADTIAMIGELMGTQYDISTESDRLRPSKSEVERLWADTSKAKDLISWTPQYEGIDGFNAGLKRTIDWFSRREIGKMYKEGVFNK